MPRSTPRADPAAHRPNAEDSTSELQFDDARVLLALCGPRNERLAVLEREARVAASLRGHTLFLAGKPDDVALAERYLVEASALARQGIHVESADLGRALRLLRTEPSKRLSDMFDDSIALGPGRRPIGPRGLAQKRYVEAIRSHDLTFGIGPAGTGKTYLAMATAVAALQEHQVKRIVLTRPAVEAGEKLGFLPGDLAEKVNPYLRPLYDALNDMMDLDRAQGLLSRGQIEVAPLAFMRGRTLNDSFVILDEAQNTTGEQMRMFLTRLGYNSKAVVTGDVTQVDLPEGKSSGLAEAEHLLSDIEGIAMCRFTDVDVVRHPLVQKIVVAYEERDARWRAAGVPVPRQSTRSLDGQAPGEPPLPPHHYREPSPRRRGEPT
jgi:phosphate starvation-inducible PhoH-like protein